MDLLDNGGGGGGGISRNLKNDDKRRLAASLELLSRRLNVAEGMITECEASLEQLHNQKITVESDLHQRSTKLSAEIKQQTKRRITLELFGIPYEDDNLTEKQLFNREKTALWFNYPCENKSMYSKMMASVTRDMAERMFTLCRETSQLVNGSFLVRQSREG